MRGLLMLFLSIGLMVYLPASAQEWSGEEEALLRLIDVDPDTPTVGIETQRVTLRDADEQIIGYAWRMAPQNERANLRHAIFAPGFSVQSEEEPPPAGSVLSYLQLAKQLNGPNVIVQVLQDDLITDRTVAGNFPLNLVNGVGNRGHIVWLIDYTERRGAVQNNSLAVQTLLRSDRYLNDVGTANSVLYGYSMGGVVARHALLTLENEGFAHNVGAYVSLDAPHRGAYLPPSLEVFARTLRNMLRNGGDKNTVGPFIRDDVKQAVTVYNSPAARQLLGIYIGRATPPYKKGPYLNAGKTKAWKKLNSHFIGLKNNNDLAKHPNFYELREELVDLGSYPTLPLNVGVSFGRADGEPLFEDPADRPTMSANVRAELEPNTRLVQASLRSIRGTHLCRVETTALNQGRSCPELALYGQHLESVFVGPGSTSDSFTQVVENVSDSEYDLNGLETAAAAIVGMGLPSPPLAPVGWLAIGGINITGSVAPTDERLTFLPMASAFDDKGWAATYPNGTAIGALRSPFDFLIADRDPGETGEPGDHEIITNDVLDQILDRLEMANVYTTQKTRIGTIGNNTINSPTSDYWNVTGNFDTLRYIIPQNIRELRIVRDADAEIELSVIRHDQARIASIIAGL